MAILVFCDLFSRIQYYRADETRRDWTRFHSAIGSASGCRCKGRRFEIQLGHLTFVEIDNEIISSVIPHFHSFKKAVVCY